ncbi:MAG: histone deacetylase [Saprospiraceae bacterium]|nr:histone deacetylase [Saprospiraceae bacterium]
MIKVAFSPVYRYQLPEGHRFPMQKYELLPEQIVRSGILDASAFFAPDLLPIDDLLLTHDEVYWQKLASLTLSRKEEREIGFPIREDLIVRGRHIAQGTLDCALHAQHGGVALNIAGGTHHAYRDRGAGFCVLNDIAIASNVLLEKRLAKRILIIDLDVHQGNGTAAIFQDNENVFTFSMHGASNYPLRKESSDLDIGLNDNASDQEYLKTLDDALIEINHAFTPDLIFYLAGADILLGDKLGRLAVSVDGCFRRDLRVMQFAQQMDVPIAVTMGGGYHHRLATLIDAHANTYRAAVEVFQ